MRDIHRKFRSDSKIGRYFDEIVELYRQGWSSQRLGKKFGIDPSNIYRNLIRRGIIVRNHSEASRISYDLGISKPLRGSRAGAWNGGFCKHTEGYVLVKNPDHPKADNRGYVGEHILVAEKMVGRRLRVDEVAHHINRKRDDNRPENLKVMKLLDHRQLHGREGGYAKAANAQKLENF